MLRAPKHVRKAGSAGWGDPYAWGPQLLPGIPWPRCPIELGGHGRLPGLGPQCSPCPHALLGSQASPLARGHLPALGAHLHPVVLGLHVHLWLLAAQPLGHPCHPSAPRPLVCPLALGALGVQVALRHHLSQGSQLHPALQGLLVGQAARCPLSGLAVPVPQRCPLSPGVLEVLANRCRPSSLEAHPVLVVPAHRRLECPFPP